jgi:hypothetical protein
LCAATVDPSAGGARASLRRRWRLEKPSIAAKTSYPDLAELAEVQIFTLDA